VSFGQRGFKKSANPPKIQKQTLLFQTNPRVMSEGRKKRAASTNAGKKNKLSALEQMAKAREGGGRNAQFEVRNERRISSPQKQI
jgi:hypothetical protein